MEPIITEGKPVVDDFDKGYYTDDHDVPALWIGGRIMALGNGYKSWPGGKEEHHLRWKLNPEKTYRVTIEEVKR